MLSVRTKQSKSSTPRVVAHLANDLLDLMYIDSTSADQLEQLLAAGANPNALGPDCTYPLHHANADKTRILIAKGADPKCCNRVGATPLHLAAMGDDVNRIQQLLDAGASINKTCSIGYTPIARAVQMGCCNAAKFLKDRGACLDIYQETIVNLAVVSGSVDMVKLFVTSENVNEKDSDGDTPAHTWVGSDNLDILKVLLDNGADLTVENVYGESVCDLLEDRVTEPLCALLKPYHYDFPFVRKDPLIQCITEHDFKKASILIKCMDTVADYDKNGNSALSLLAKIYSQMTPPRSWANDYESHVENEDTIVSLFYLLVERGADVNAEPPALIHVVKNPELVQLLISKNANVHATTPKGYTALHEAVRVNNVKSVELLIAANADRFVKAKSYKTPAHFITSQTHEKIVSMLKE